MLTRLKSLGIAISNQHGKTRRDALMLGELGLEEGVQIDLGHPRTPLILFRRPFA